MNYTSRLDKAVKLSARLHKNQVRKDKHQTPYSMHPFAVMCIVSNYTDEEDTLIAALMHDVLEDVELPYKEKENLIRDEFGENVLKIVKGVTEDKDPLHSKKGMEEWKRLKLRYLETLQTAPKQSLYISAADKIHNLMSTQAGLEEEGDAVWTRLTHPPEGRHWFSEEVYKVIKSKFDCPIVDDLLVWIKKVHKI